MKYKCVIFDFDGTLANTENVIFRVYNEIAKKYGYKEITHDYIDELKHQPIHNIIKDLGVPYLKVFSLIKKGQKLMKEYHKSMDPYEEDLKETLKILKSKLSYMGIISSNSKKNINTFLKNEKIDTMDFIISSPLFSKEIKINKLKKKLKLKDEDILYVGDEVRDIVSAKKANIDIASVTYGYNTKEYLSSENPTYFIDDLKELFNIIEK
ncbi:HAD-IA family hydrolase [Anaerofustis stercorihominis]|uniref:HAD hydrolase, family IA, variant 1 n=3 Tax=Anaerofustis stercorihominis TaxID=214853 RepID=B1CBH4_9FIRM|nr:HAD-IA family hydrolase [Anaerofustis stercorihominis]EDS71621.1 HAD hydrolase, family IA, variant 1 [Anaerofustis stercorihominis DSM 17244]MCQ4796320.1 HAD-IA family hydrolase [Anaerofustis stercorihominis]RGD75303.1 phosphoglycolate phosphatase [Anaerofustis stercorihominis]